VFPFNNQTSRISSGTRADGLSQESLKSWIITSNSLSKVLISRTWMIFRNRAASMLFRWNFAASAFCVVPAYLANCAKVRPRRLRQDWIIRTDGPKPPVGLGQRRTRTDGPKPPVA